LGQGFQDKGKSICPPHTQSDGGIKAIDNSTDHAGLLPGAAADASDRLQILAARSCLRERSVLDVVTVVEAGGAESGCRGDEVGDGGPRQVEAAGKVKVGETGKPAITHQTPVTIQKEEFVQDTDVF